MNEVDHALHQYEGDPGELVTITVTAHNTTHMVSRVIDGGAPVEVPAGTPIRFNLKNTSGDETRLQLTLGFNSLGSYDIIVENVDDCPHSTPPQCLHSRSGSKVILESHQYFVR